MSNKPTPPLTALYIRGTKDLIFDIADQIGFEGDMDALSVSLFEDGPNHLHIQTLFSSPHQAQAMQERLPLSDDLEYFITDIEDEDWVAKSQAGLPPVIAGRFCIYGRHDQDNIPPDCLYPIKIDAGPAFGTGHHGTTHGCLLILDELISAKFHPQSVLDLGCGAGTLAIAAAKAFQTSIIATDIDPDAVKVTQDNSHDNDVTDWIHTLHVNGLDHPYLQDRKFDLIFANILAGPLIDLAPDIAVALAEDGYMILSGILDAQSPSVEAAFLTQSVQLRPHSSLNGWTSLIGQFKPRPDIS